MTTATIIPSLTNNPPSRANPAAFPTDGDSFLNDLPGVVSGVNTAATELNTWNAEVETFKNQASSSQTNAANSSTTSLTQARNAAASMVSLWVSGTTYPAGQIVYSSVDGREYKRITAGAGTTDPSSDTTNWEPLGWEYITNYPDIRPTLDLNFAGSQTVDPRITFTRNSTATYFDKFGVMQTAGINQPRIDFDPVTGECKGLLIEEQRTNLLLRSEEFDNAYWTKADITVLANQIIAPDGTLTADKIIPNATSNVHTIYRTGLASGVNTGSFYVKAAEYSTIVCYVAGAVSIGAVFNLQTKTVQNINEGVGSIQEIGNGWFRCSVYSPTAGSIFYLYPNSSGGFIGDDFSGIYIWGVQLEAGAFATSYIPTVASQVTRAADAASMTGANFSSWYRANEGALYSEASVLSVANTNSQNIWSLYTGTTNHVRHWLWSGAPSVPRLTVFSGTHQAELTFSAQVAGAAFKNAASYRVNDFASSLNGGTVGTDTSGVVPVGFSSLHLGSYTGVSEFMSGHIRKIAYYPVRLPNQILQAITQP